jgi:hypothetical protein
MSLPYKAAKIAEFRLFSCVIAGLGKAANPR